MGNLGSSIQQRSASHIMHRLIIIIMIFMRGGAAMEAGAKAFALFRPALHMINHPSFIHRKQCVTRSLFQFSRREREFLFLNLVLQDENENFIFQSQASRREREPRLRQFSREFLGITFIACLLIDIFKK